MICEGKARDRTRGAFTTYAHTYAKKRAMAAGVSEDVALAFARKTYAAAVLFWNSR